MSFDSIALLLLALAGTGVFSILLAILRPGGWWPNMRLKVAALLLKEALCCLRFSTLGFLSA